jgi:hypothetical protein
VTTSSPIASSLNREEQGSRDLGPKGAERVLLREDDRVELVGDMKPSELKVHSIAVDGGARSSSNMRGSHTDLCINWTTPTRGPLLKTAEVNALTVLGKPSRKAALATSLYAILWLGLRDA